ncbi:hypothetical protein KKC17_00075 [Patescibacteria group bacterium]|nr:hypothetical protein [Patescibacteria group bacterium]
MSPLQPVSGASHKSNKPRKEQMALSSVFLSVLLAVALIGLGQRGLYDLNRLYNPHYQVCNQANYLLSAGESCLWETYAFKTVLLHSYLSLPLFLIFLGLVFYFRKRRLGTWQTALYRVSNGVAIFFGVEFILEVIVYLFQYHKVAAWYTSLGLAALLLAILVVYIERRRAFNKKTGQGH